MVPKNVIVGYVKPEGAVVSQEIVKVKVAVAAKRDGMRSPDTVDGNVMSIVGVSGRGQGAIMLAKDKVSELKL